MAPEHFAEDHTLLTPGTDSWSVGCILYRLFTGRIFSHNEGYIYWHTGKPGPRQGLMEKGLSEAGIRLIEECYKEKPEERLTATAALQHPWLKVETGNVEAIYEISEQLREKLLTRSTAIVTSPSYVYALALGTEETSHHTYN